MHIIPLQVPPTQTFFNNVPNIIQQAAQNPLGVFSLMILVLAFLAFFYFRDASENTRTFIFVLLFIGTALFAFSLSSSSGKPNSQQQLTQAEQRACAAVKQAISAKTLAELTPARDDLKAVISQLSALSTDAQVGTDAKFQVEQYQPKLDKINNAIDNPCEKRLFGCISLPLTLEGC